MALGEVIEERLAKNRYVFLYRFVVSIIFLFHFFVFSLQHFGRRVRVDRRRAGVAAVVSRHP